MYKLTVVAGPDAGKSYSVVEGENSIGRVSGNAVVLPSSRVSKKHCVLIYSNGQLVVRDQGSANGTFVNGTLTRERNIRVGDRISVGEYVLELSERMARQSASRAAGQSGGAVIPFPGISGLPADMNAGGGHPGGTGLSSLQGVPGGIGAPDVAADLANAVPTDLKGKALFYFDRFVMPVFYGLNQKNEWRFLCAGLLAAFGVANLVLSVQPLLKSGRDAVVRETGRRATFMAKMIADRNAPILAAKAETKTDLGGVDAIDGVRVTVLTDLDGRIIAPAQRMNQYLTSGGEALFANKARDLFRKGRETGLVAEPDDSTVVAVEPVKVISTQAGKNVVIGMAVVSIDTTLSTLGMGDMGVVYSQTLILTCLFGGLILVIMYRMTLKPLQVLSDEIDKALKGELAQVTHEFKLEELNPLWDLINSALQRIPRAGAGSANAGNEVDNFNIDEFISPFRALAQQGGFGLFICDSERKIRFMNPIFEEASGIRNENAVGQDVAAVARDQAFIALMSDLFERAPLNPEGVGDEVEFSGIAFHVHAMAYNSGMGVKAYVITAMKTGGE
jgi:PAS domain-containing protein